MDTQCFLKQNAHDHSNLKALHGARETTELVALVGKCLYSLKSGEGIHSELQKQGYKCQASPRYSDAAVLGLPRYRLGAWSYAAGGATATCAVTTPAHRVLMQRTCVSAMVTTMYSINMPDSTPAALDES